MKRQLPALVLAATSGLAAQSPAPTPTARFEVASVRQNVSAETNSSFRVDASGTITVTNNTLMSIVRNAWNVQPFQIVRGERVPDWFGRDRWNIIGKPPSGPTNQPELIVMVQNLLADRFKLVARRETREMPVYALVLARSDRRLGPQLRQADGQCEAAQLARLKGDVTVKPPQVDRGYCGTRANAGVMATSGVAMADFARNLAPQTGRFVVDRTGLTGTFDLDLKWTPDQATGAAASAATDGTSLFAALEEQLGLKLEAQRAPVDVVVIESVERPSED